MVKQCVGASRNASLQVEYFLKAAVNFGEAGEVHLWIVTMIIAVGQSLYFLVVCLVSLFVKESQHEASHIRIAEPVQINHLFGF